MTERIVVMRVTWKRWGPQRWWEDVGTEKQMSSIHSIMEQRVKGWTGMKSDCKMTQMTQNNKNCSNNCVVGRIIYWDKKHNSAFCKTWTVKMASLKYNMLLLVLSVTSPQGLIKYNLNLNSTSFPSCCKNIKTTLLKSSVTSSSQAYKV